MGHVHRTESRDGLAAMFENLKPQPDDKIIKLSQMFRADERSNKIDLGVGVYKNALGATPIMRSVKTAEKQLLVDEKTKSYTALAGDPAFHASMASLVFGEGFDTSNLAALATAGGTGALRVGLEFSRLASSSPTIWVSSPTWPNHLGIIDYLGLARGEYRYFDPATSSVDFDGMISDLQNVKAGDVVMLHGCCHNPTGANLNLAEWAIIAKLLVDKGALPFVDIAYQGFGDGLQEDAAGLRLLAAQVPELLVAVSCSKNFGIYRERTGVLFALSDSAAKCEAAQGNLSFIGRVNYSFPPDHGARLVTMILNDQTLKADWMAELEDVRLGMLDLRSQLAGALQELAGSDRFGFIGSHRGMFSLTGALPEQVDILREKHGIYMVGDGRINVAGLNSETVPILAKALIDVGV
jgi:aspartate aminotransferase